jgi:phenylalanyl-tRNA synthetase beta chain
LACFPKISRDLSIVLKEEVSLENVLREIKSVAGDLLEEAAITDFYRGKQIPAGHKSLTISCVFRSPQRTLSDAEIQPIQARLIQLVD